MSASQATAHALRRSTNCTQRPIKPPLTAAVEEARCPLPQLHSTTQRLVGISSRAHMSLASL